jgi:hypothetical protein
MLNLCKQARFRGCKIEAFLASQYLKPQLIVSIHAKRLDESSNNPDELQNFEGMTICGYMGRARRRSAAMACPGTLKCGRLRQLSIGRSVPRRRTLEKHAKGAARLRVWFFAQIDFTPKRRQPLEARMDKSSTTGSLSTRRRWTRLEDSLLRDMLRSRLTADEIARRLARTPAAVYSRVQYLDKKRLRPVAT